MKNILTIMLALILTACGAGGTNDGISAGNTAGKANKSLFSTWTATDNTIQTHFQGLAFNTQTGITMVFQDGAICDMQLALFGTESSAIGTISLSTYRGGTGTGDPGCAGISGNYKATISGDRMRLCDPPTWTTCKEYL